MLTVLAPSLAETHRALSTQGEPARNAASTYSPAWDCASGRVTDMGIRTIEITDDEGDVVLITNSKVSPVRNMSRKEAHPKAEKDSKAEKDTKKSPEK